MVKLLLVLLLTSCSHKPIKPIFYVGQCVQLNQKKLPSNMYTENIPMTIISITKTSIKIKFFYKLEYKSELFIISVKKDIFYKRFKVCNER